MDYAFSLAALETLSVDEFLELDGDDGWLIGKNLIVCSECRANVFLRKGDKRRPHFAHTKFTDKNEGCSKRVGEYTPDKVRQIRAKQSKYRVGYFQQRFEDYTYISLLDTLKKSNLFFVSWANGSGNKPVIALEKVTDEKYSEQIKTLREMGSAINLGINNNSKNAGIRDLADAAKYWLKLNRQVVEKIGIDEFKSSTIESLKSEGSIGILNTDLTEQLSSLSFRFGNREQLFAAEAINHLLTKGAEPLVASAMSAAMQLFLSTELTRVWRKHATNLGVFESNSYAMSTDFLHSYLDDATQHPQATFTTARLLRSWLQAFEDDDCKQTISKLLDMEGNISKFGLIYDKSWTGSINKRSDKPYFTETFSFIYRLFKFINFSQTAACFYGDNPTSIEETRRNTVDDKRGFIYIAWAPYLKDVWQIDLKRMNLSECVKIGYSDDPERRKTEIAGNIGPADSISIEDV